MIVDRVEQIQIKHSHNLYDFCDELSFASKNIYNYANYIIRQEFINNNKWIRYNDLHKLLKTHETYKALPAQTAQQTLRLLDKNWKSFKASIRDWSKNKDKYLGRPRIPAYKRKDGRNIVIFTYQQCKIVGEHIIFPKTDLTLRTSISKNLKQVRIIPKGSIYLVEVVYEKEIKDIQKPTKNIGLRT
jgi:putative transposase